jgi:hypothetical protein
MCGEENEPQGVNENVIANTSQSFPLLTRMTTVIIPELEIMLEFKFPLFYEY